MIWAAVLEHRGRQIKDALIQARPCVAVVRNRHTRYRAPMFDNRRRPSGWLPPSLQSRVEMFDMALPPTESRLSTGISLARVGYRWI